MKNSATSSIELQSLAQKIGLDKENFPLRGVFSRDQIPKKLEVGSYIINQDGIHGSGTHWVALVMLTPNRGYYFDSFGFPPPMSIVKRAKSPVDIIYNDIDVQDMESQQCGFFAIAFLKLIVLKKYSFEKAVDTFFHGDEKTLYRNRKVVERILSSSV